MAKELYEFGPFRVDPEKETLFRAGESVPLTPKTFQILLVLIRNSNEVVTKDDLMKTVWPDTFVEEANLSRNVFMLRKALGESAQDHRYIVTVPGRGYRLAESVQLVPDQELTVIAASHSKMQLEMRDTRPWRWIAIAALVVLLVVALAHGASFTSPNILSAKDTVVLADFANTTGDAMFDETLRQGLAIQLEQSPFLSLVSDQRIHHTLHLMGQLRDTVTAELARGVCERTGSAAVLEGSIAPLGSQYVLDLQAKSCRTGEVLDHEQVQAAKKEDVLNALSQIANRFRKRVGESLTTIQEHNTPLADATTSSLEALEAYSAGWKLHTTMERWLLPLVKRAVEIDPNFALAHATLGRQYADLDESDLSAASTTRAWQRRIAPAIRKSSSSQRLTKYWQREIWNRRDRSVRHGHIHILVKLSLTSCCRAIQTRPRVATDRLSPRRERRLNSNRTLEWLITTWSNNVYLDRPDEAENAFRRATDDGWNRRIPHAGARHRLSERRSGWNATGSGPSPRKIRHGTWISNKEAFVSPMQVIFSRQEFYPGARLSWRFRKRSRSEPALLDGRRVLARILFRRRG